MNQNLLRIGCLAVAAMPMLAGACGTPSDANPILEPAALKIVAGDAQTAPAGSELPIILQVRVTDTKDRPVPNVPVTWEVTSGGGSLWEATTATDVNGIATNRWTVGKRVRNDPAGQQRVQASIRTSAGATLAAIFRATNVAGPVARISLFGHASDTVGAVVRDSIRAAVYDSHGNPVTGAEITWWASAGSVSPSSTAAESEWHRVQWTLGTAAGVDTLYARAPSGASAILVGTVRAGAPVSLTVPQQSIETSYWTTQFIEGRLLDRFGNTTGHRPTWRLLDSNLIRIESYSSTGVIVRPLAAGTATLLAEWSGQSVPVTVTIRSIRVAKVSVGDEYNGWSNSWGTHVCALTTDGEIGCWGYNQAGELGNGSGAANYAHPRKVAGQYTQVTAGRGFTCGRHPDGTVSCWGLNDSGQLGASTSSSCVVGGLSKSCSYVPVKSVGGATFQEIQAGGTHVCAARGDGTISCWGSNQIGQLGNGTVASSQQPVMVSTTLKLTGMTLGGQHTCALEQGTGTAYCWGRGAEGQLGATLTELCASVSCATTPIKVDIEQQFVQLFASGNYTCGRTTTSVYCWGQGYGMKPIFDQSATFVHASAGFDHRCGYTLDGRSYCWGINHYGQLGTGNRANSATPVAVQGALSFSHIDVGGNLSCGVGANAAVYCWGAFVRRGGIRDTGWDQPNLLPGQG